MLGRNGNLEFAIGVVREQIDKGFINTGVNGELCGQIRLIDAWIKASKDKTNCWKVTLTGPYVSKLFLLKT